MEERQKISILKKQITIANKSKNKSFLLQYAMKDITTSNNFIKKYASRRMMTYITLVEML